VQHRAHLLWRQIDRRLAVVAAHETVPVLVAFDLAFDLAQQGSARHTGGRMDDFFDDKIFR
jgi:aryl-alcohol dehydrogenase-like predicted oxidoreductase